MVSATPYQWYIREIEPSNWISSGLRHFIRFTIRPQRKAILRQITCPPADTNTDIGTNNTTTANSILFGDKEVVKASVTCVRIIHNKPDKKAMMEVLFNERHAMAKCWSDGLERHAHSTDE